MFWLRAGPALPRPGLPGVGEAEAHVRTRRHQLQEVAPVERQVDDALVLDHGADRRILRGYQSRPAGDFNNFAHGADFHGEVEARRLLYLQLDVVACDRAETGHLDFKIVFPRQESRKIVDAGLVTDSRPGEVCRRIR